MALRPEALTACNRILATEVSRWQKAASGIEGAETGSVAFVQRFHSSLGSFVHFHLVSPDGVFVKENGRVTFHAGRTPSGDDIESVARGVARRMNKWLRRRGLAGDAEDRGDETPEPSPIEVCMQLSLFGATYARVDDGIEWPMREARGHRAENPWARSADGFEVHAGVTVRRGDRAGLERLARYGARPAFSLERLSLLESGRVAYLLKKPRRGGATHLVMTPVQFLARIAALVPPPRYPLVRFAGVLAPGSTWRRAVVAKRPTLANPTLAARAGAGPRRERRKKLSRAEVATPATTLPLGSRDLCERGDSPSRFALADPERLTADLPPCARIDWASLLRRVYMDDVLACPCGGRRRIVADVQDRDVVVEILVHLGLDADPPPVARARDPTLDHVA
jgi:hypothetical protein